MDNLNSALNYRKQGLPVIPLFEGTKKAIVPWKKFTYRLPTEQEVTDWWTKYPTANIAMVTGNISKKFVLDTEKDFDPKNLPGEIKTRTSKTGSGGRHYFFNIPDGIKIPTLIEIWGKDPAFKADIKGEAGYVVLPPSFNAKLNSNYEYLDESQEISEPPEWLLKLVTEAGSKRKSIPLKNLVSGAEAGNRNVSAASFIGHLFAKTAEELWEVSCWPTAVAWNKKCKPPLGEKELRDVFDSISKKAFQDRVSGQGGKINSIKIIESIDESGMSLFHDQVDEGYAKIDIKDGYQIYKIKGGEFQRYLSSFIWSKFGRTVSGETLKTVVNTLDGRAKFDGIKQELEIRTAWFEGSLWFDLGMGKAVKINGTNWEIVPKAPILFKNFYHQKVQVNPIPADAKDIEKIFTFMNLGDDENLRLLMAVYLCTVLMPDIPRPVLVVHGQQGSAKSTLLRVVKSLIDPSELDLLTYPRNSEELIQVLSHHFLVYFDNVSEIKEWLSDDLCRAVTGQAFSKRRLYTDDEDVVYKFKRALGMNGINLIAQKPDLLDRSLIYELEPITSRGRRDEESFWSKFNEELPKILGAVFTILSKAMSIKDSIVLEEKPRLADYALWGSAIAEAIGYGKESFMLAYKINIDKQNQEALSASPVAQLTLALMEDQRKWSGSPKQLLDAFEKIAETHGLKKELPKSVRWLRRRINEVKANLNAADIDVVYNDSARPRSITFINRTSKPLVADAFDDEDESEN